MRVAIHQPEHFPYMGFFQKMSASDLFVILDDVQYTKGGWQNRNRFLNKNGVDDFFTVQVERHANQKKINEVKVVEGPWRKKIVKKIQQNFNLDFENLYNKDKLIDINMASIEWARKQLNITTEIVMSSDLKINSTKTQRILDICRSVGATEYISGPGAVSEKTKSYLEPSLFTDIKLSIFYPKVDNYYSVLQNTKRTNPK